MSALTLFVSGGSCGLGYFFGAEQGLGGNVLVAITLCWEHIDMRESARLCCIFQEWRGTSLGTIRCFMEFLCVHGRVAWYFHTRAWFGYDGVCWYIFWGMYIVYLGSVHGVGGFASGSFWRRSVFFLVFLWSKVFGWVWLGVFRLVG